MIAYQAPYLLPCQAHQEDARDLDPYFKLTMAHPLQVWDNAEEFLPERFDLEGQIPNEVNTDFR